MEEELGELVECLHRAFLLPSDANIADTSGERLGGGRFESDIVKSILLQTMKSNDCTGIGRLEI